MTSNEFIPIRIYKQYYKMQVIIIIFETNINNIKYCYNQKILINKF